MNKKCGDVLIELGITPNLDGFDYICAAVNVIHSNPYNKQITKVYNEVSNRFNKSIYNVDRAIRHAFTKCNVNSIEYKNWLGNSQSNSERLYILAYRLEEYKDE